MQNSVYIISLSDLFIAFIPTIAVLIILHVWQLNARYSLYAIARMLMQLLLAGYLLAYIMQTNNLFIISLVISIMVLASAWIALGICVEHRRKLFTRALTSIALGGGIVLLLVTQGVLHLDPWYSARYMIPLAGMIFANSMTSISLAAERLSSELNHGNDFNDSRATAFRAALIPIINSLLAVGIVSLPGMMTGQILSGVSPLIAARYQIVVMCMIFSSTGLSTACFLMLSKQYYHKNFNAK